MTMETGKFKICKWANVTDSKNSWRCSSNLRRSTTRISCSGKVGICFIEAFSWLDEAEQHMEYNLLYSVHQFKC